MPQHALDPEHIHVVSWNIAKGGNQDWQSDLQHLTHNADLALIQEARLEHSMHQVMPDACWAFAPGFRRRNHTTGVMTIARAETIYHSTHRHREPFTLLPKAALITEYRLKNRADTLLVANVHAINFTPGTGHFQRQLQAIVTPLAAHTGPLILSGDFNTWRGKRQRILQELIDYLDLHTIAFAHDHRRHSFGFALDHLFYRGLYHKSGIVSRVFSSDHNPISVVLGS
ncbi:MAG TPA: endonuclease/exonuclease/phosphatase family protein [Spongiibacteraceae bacterium]|jgi:endonuclease/exonuclease/phosphatase (EEP) superfamily protein YafD